MQNGYASYRRKVWVAFWPNNKKGWFWRWVGPFGHVSLFIEDSAGKLIHINQTSGGLFFELIPFSAETYLRHAKGMVVLEWEANGLEVANKRKKGIITCVSVAKSALGINDFWILTPKQLYRRIRHGRDV